MSKKDPNLGAEGSPTDKDISDLIPDGDKWNPPDDWDSVGESASGIDENELPRREQMNVDIARDVKERFYEHVEENGGQIRFHVEDLIRLYLSEIDSDS